VSRAKLLKDLKRGRERNKKEVKASRNLRGGRRVKLSLFIGVGGMLGNSLEFRLFDEVRFIIRFTLSLT
jgi:hypothetical protein